MRIEITEDRDFAGRGAKQSGKDTQQGRFARSVFSEKDVAAARNQFDRDLTKRGKRPEEPGDRFQTGQGNSSRGGVRPHFSLRLLHMWF